MIIPKNIKAVIFDMDGLLIDSEPVWDEADKVILGKRGHKRTDEITLKILGTGNKQTIETYKEEFGITDSTEELMEERMISFYEILEEKLSLMEGAQELIKKFSAAGKKLAIATSGSHKEKIGWMLDHLEVTQYFSVIVTGQDIKQNKPAPDIFLKAAKELGYPPVEGLVLEDAPNGVRAGKAAGMRVFGVNKDPNIAKELKKMGADKVFSSLSEITI